MKNFFIALTVALSLPVFAADPAKTTVDPKAQEAMNAWTTYATPGEVHKVLQSLVGKWKYTSKWWASPTAKPEKSSGSSVMKAILGGRFIRQELKGVAMGQKFEGMGLLGYDNVSGKFESLWLDTMGTGIIHGKGTYEANTKTFTDSGEFTDPTSATKTRSYRSEWKLIGKNQTSFTMWIKGEDGKEFKSMEMNYIR